MIPYPYLLYIGASVEPLSVKTARGLAYWRPERCLGQARNEGCTIDLGLPDMSFEQAAAAGAKTMVLGVANAGGFMSDAIVEDVVAALGAGLNVASGLHERLASHPRIVAAAENAGVQLFDVRQPPENLPVGNGLKRAGKRLLAVGTDCAVGKMYSTLALERELHARGIAADFRATGQTGILIAGSGVPIDAVVADFIAGAAEWVSPERNDGGWDLIEGQGSLFHASFAGVSMGLMHGSQPDALLLCHQAGRKAIRHLPSYQVPDLATCLARNLEAARLTNPAVVAVGVAINTSGLAASEAERTCKEAEDQLGLPCQDPVAHGVERIVDNMLKCFA